MANNDIVSTLFFELQDTELFQGVSFEEIDKPIEKFMEKEGLNPNQRSELLDIFTDMSSYCERNGFQQGLKLGLRLMASAMDGKDT